MRLITTPNHHRGHNKERGAALVMTLMISALVLTAGGILVLTTSMAGTNTVDTTSEAQAYYGAEAGLQATLNVLRGRVLPNPLFVPNPSGTVAVQNRITFAKAVSIATSNKPSDPTNAGFPARLSRWLTYNYTPPGVAYPDRVAINPSYTPMNGIAYSVVVTDPDNVAPAEPTRLQIQSTGYGPRGARKTLSILVKAYGLLVDEIPAPLVLRGHDDAVTEMNFDAGSSGAETYSGLDYSGQQPIKPALAIVTHDIPAFQDATVKMKSKIMTNPQYAVLDVPNEPAPLGVKPPWFLKTANDARTFLAQAETLAQAKGTLLPYLDGSAGSLTNPKLTVVKGDCHLYGGAGLLVVEGTLYIKGSGINFNGLILVLGQGKVIKTGGGNKDIYGSVMIARFGSSGDFLEPTWDVQGGGSSNLQYDSMKIWDGLDTTGKPLLGIVER
jgi:hypothetical protein